MIRSFAMASCDELFVDGRLVQRRISYGEAVHDEGANEIHATDAGHAALVAACERAMDELRGHVVSDARVRLIAEISCEDVVSTLVITMEGLSIVTTPMHVLEDVALLRDVIATTRGPRAERPEGVSLLWKHGSASVLLHEAVGHAIEHGQTPVQLPDWLTVEAPLQIRRASFRDVPLTRMTDLVARQTGAPFQMPEERIEILLVDGGAYDPLTERVTLRIAAAVWVRGEEQRVLAPFTLEEHRADVASSLRGASGDPIRYPGVVCSREGQALVVGSFAPLMLTESR